MTSSLLGTARSCSFFIQANLKCFTKILLGTTLLYLISLSLLTIRLSRAAIASSCCLLSFPSSRLPCDFMVNVHEPKIRLLPPWENQEVRGNRLYRREFLGYIWVHIRKKEGSRKHSLGKECHGLCFILSHRVWIGQVEMHADSSFLQSKTGLSVCLCAWHRVAITALNILDTSIKAFSILINYTHSSPKRWVPLLSSSFYG